jgi:hypothetical protein
MSIKFSDGRFLETDVAALQSMGFVRLVDRNKSGNPIYAITRAGSAFAATLPAVQIDNERLILVRFEQREDVTIRHKTQVYRTNGFGDHLQHPATPAFCGLVCRPVAE